MIEKIEIGKIVRLTDKIDRAKAARIESATRDGEVFPPILLKRLDGMMDRPCRILDGNQRYQAAKAIGRATMPAEIQVQ